MLHYKVNVLPGVITLYNITIITADCKLLKGVVRF